MECDISSNSLILQKKLRDSIRHWPEVDSSDPTTEGYVGKLNSRNGDVTRKFQEYRAAESKTAIGNLTFCELLNLKDF